MKRPDNIVDLAKDALADDIATPFGITADVDWDEPPGAVDHDGLLGSTSIEQMKDCTADWTGKWHVEGPDGMDKAICPYNMDPGTLDILRFLERARDREPMLAQWILRVVDLINLLKNSRGHDADESIVGRQVIVDLIDAVEGQLGPSPASLRAIPEVDFSMGIKEEY
jgi:hypothetical protein